MSAGDTLARLRRVSERVAAIAPSATLAVDAKAKALRLAGQDVIGFGLGEPDFPTPEHIVEAAAAACREPANHHYGATAGLAELREQVAAKTARDSGYNVTAGQVLVTNGAKQAVAEAFETLLDPGDEVLVVAPYWTTYPEAIALAGGVAVPVVTDEESGFIPSVEALLQAATERTKALLFVSPSNPTGAVATRQQVAEIGCLALEEGWWVVSDEIYEHFVYDGYRSFSMPVVVPELAERSIVINGVSKSYAMTGWRVGWMIGPADVVAAAANLQSHLCSNVNNVAQWAAVAALDGDQSSVARMVAVFDERRRRIVARLNEMPGVSCPEPHGAFYAYANLAGVLGREIRGRRPATSLELADLVLTEAKVAFVPGEAFGTKGYGRFSYALSDEELDRGMDAMAALLAEQS